MSDPDFAPHRDLTAVQVGDTIVVASGYRSKEPSITTVTKIGRLNFTVADGWRSMTFRRADGTEVRRPNERGAPYVAYTPESWKIERRHVELREAIHSASRDRLRSMPVEQLEAAAAALGIDIEGSA